MAIHFGVTVLPGKKGLKISRDNYAIINNKNTLFTKRTLEHYASNGMIDPDMKVKINGAYVKYYADKSGLTYSDEWCIEHQKQCLLNYDLNMAFFETIDRIAFQNEVQRFLKEFPQFVEVIDLNDLENKTGYYIMVLDDYCQVYVGNSLDIKKRVRQHWANSKSFDRLLFPQGAFNKSILSIDSFRALDTTRIFASLDNDIYDMENEYLNGFPPEFCLNRISGGRLEENFLELLSMIKSRRLRNHTEQKE